MQRGNTGVTGFSRTVRYLGMLVCAPFFFFLLPFVRDRQGRTPRSSRNVYLERTTDHGKIHSESASLEFHGCLAVRVQTHACRESKRIRKEFVKNSETRELRASICSIHRVRSSFSQFQFPLVHDSFLSVRTVSYRAACISKQVILTRVSLLVRRVECRSELTARVREPHRGNGVSTPPFR